MTVSSSSSGAALCHVTVSNDVLEKDLVLHLILESLSSNKAVAAHHQVHVDKIPSPAKNTLTMTVSNNHHMILKQRNTIVRSLVGVALHGAFDNYHSGAASSSMLLAGGMLSTATSTHGTSLRAAANMAHLMHWMSRCRATDNNNDTTTESLVSDLDEWLENSNFLLSYSPTVSIADLDVGTCLLKNSIMDEYSPNVMRWLRQVSSVIHDLAKETGIQLPFAPFRLPKKPSPAVFFYGTEENAETLLSDLHELSNKQKNKSANAAKANKKQQDQKGGKKKQQGEDATPKPATESNKKKKNKGGGDTGKKNQAPAVVEYDVTALDIRVGKIVKVWPHKTADKLFCEEIDLGNDEIRQIASGLRPFYKESDLQDRMVLVLCNLKKRNLVGFPSHGMVLCASNDDHTIVKFVVPPEGSQLGERVMFDGLDANKEPEPENKVAKKKIFEKLAPDLKTDANGNVVWKTYPAKTSTGAVQALDQMANASVS